MGIFFIELIRNQQNSKVLSNTNTPYNQERLEEFLELLETHIFSQKQVSQYADILNLSSFQLNAITKATLGKNCSELINEYVILESKRYLLATSNKVCLLYTSDAADEEDSVDLGGRRIIKKKKEKNETRKY